MKWQGRQGSGNIEDRRGMSTGRKVIGGGIGTIVIVIIVLLLGGDPAQFLDTIQQGSPTTETGQVVTTPEEDEMAQFVSVVLKDTETVWSKIFEQSGSVLPAAKACPVQGPGSVGLWFCKRCQRTFLLPG